MSHGLELVDDDDEIVAEEYLSYNWSDMKNEKRAGYFHINKVCGHTGDKGVIDQFEFVLNELEQHGATPNTSTKVDGWGNLLPGYRLRRAKSEIEEKSESEQPIIPHTVWYKFLKMSCIFGPTIDDKQDVDVLKEEEEEGINFISKEEFQSEKLHMFATHIQRFLKTARQYPEGRWYSDSCEINEKLGEYSGVPRKVHNDDSSDDSDADSLWLTKAYYRHPIKGHMCIDSATKAIEVYRLTLEKGDPRADGWYEFAKRLALREAYIDLTRDDSSTGLGILPNFFYGYLNDTWPDHLYCPLSPTADTWEPNFLNERHEYIVKKAIEIYFKMKGDPNFRSSNHQQMAINVAKNVVEEYKKMKGGETLGN